MPLYCFALTLAFVKLKRKLVSVDKETSTNFISGGEDQPYFRGCSDTMWKARSRGKPSWNPETRIQVSDQEVVKITWVPGEATFHFTKNQLACVRNRNEGKNQGHNLDDSISILRNSDN